MCGIAGFYGRPIGDVGNAVLDCLAHRGPDGRGRYDDPGGDVSLFHTRLAILDPGPHGAQPMRANDGRVVITFNGEIYNFRELRSGLEKQGVEFRSRSDTEVMLALYLRDGMDFIGQLNGIYAFALWDARSASLLVARDGLGVKPLYYSEAAGAFAFASEMKALLHFPWIPRTPDHDALVQYVRHLWCPSPRSPWREVNKLEPGAALLVQRGRIVKRWRHYSLPAPGSDPVPGPTEWATEVRTTLAEAVQQQMVSDVPLGAFLSGGLDSSAVVALARARAADRLQCFTIDFDAELARREGFVRDLPFAQRVARHLDVDLHVVHVGAEMADELDAMVWQLDEPQADFSALNVLYISRLARRHGIKVLLSGAGGDDVFSGYRRHRALMTDAYWRRMPRALRNLLAGLGRRLPQGLPALRRIGKLLSAADLDRDERLLSYFDWTAPADLADVFAPGVAGQPPDRPLRDALHAMSPAVSPLQRMLLLEQRFFLADHNLNYTDKMSMAAGVEVRVPFLAPQVMELAARIPDRYRQHGAQGKWILKQALQADLPHDVIHRPKTGFGVPLRMWLRGPLQTMLHDLLSEQTLRRRGLFNAAAVQRMMEDNAAGRADHAYTLLALMCIELWLRRFMDTQPA